MPKRKSKKPVRKLTKLQLEYQKQINRLNRAVKRGQKSGKEYDTEKIPKMPKRVTQKSLQSIKDIKPKHIQVDTNNTINLSENEREYVQNDIKVTKELADNIVHPKSTELFKWVGDKLINTETGEVLKQSNSKAIQDYYLRKLNATVPKEPKQVPTPVQINYPSFSSTVINNFTGYVRGFPSQISNKVLTWLSNLTTVAGTERVAQMLEDSALKLSDYLSRVGYDSDGAISEFCTDMLNYLPEMSDNEKMDIMDDVEADEWQEGSWDE